MYSQTFQCTIEEPLILFKKAKTEQSTETLEYIPGSLFRGFVAGKLFKDKEARTNGIDDKLIDNIVFDGSVCFGDAHLIISGERSNPIPFSFHRFKENGEIVNLAAVEETPPEKHKQIREGYFIGETGELSYQKISTSERMKAARSLDNRASKEGAMYLYRFIQPGQSFEFTIKADDDELLKKVTAYLSNNNVYLGKSKSAEFGGRLSIKEKVNSSSTGSVPDYEKVKSLYAASNWCFINEYGTYTTQLTGEMLCGNPEAKIDWNKSHVRFRTYAPFNAHRNAYDAQRLILEKGSVIVFKEEIETKESFFAEGIGCHLTEGFGEVLINPEFLSDSNPSLKEVSTNKTENGGSSHDPIYKILENRKNAKESLVDDYQKAAVEFDKIKEGHKLYGVKTSQWGNVWNKIRDLEDINVIIAKLFEDKNFNLLKNEKTSKWSPEQFKELKEIAQKSTSAQSFKILIKLMINRNKNE